METDRQGVGKRLLWQIDDWQVRRLANKMDRRQVG